MPWRRTGRSPHKSPWEGLTALEMPKGPPTRPLGVDNLGERLLANLRYDRVFPFLAEV
jgi:hypothetical protein